MDHIARVEAALKTYNEISGDPEPKDLLAMAQIYAMLGIWAELKRYNDAALKPRRSRVRMADVPESEWPDA